MKKTFITHNDKETKILGKNMGLELRKKKKAVIFALIGNLGAGKTTFLQGFAKGLGIKEKVLSPSFVIIKKFKIKIPKSGINFFYHLDCYRIKKIKEILELGFKKIITDPQNIVAIEWPEKIQKLLPKKTIWIFFEIGKQNKRKITIKDF